MYNLGDPVKSVYKIGDKVICINNTNQERSLIIGKIYTIINICYNEIIIDNDNYGGFYGYRFKSLQEMRKKKLNNILNEI